MRFMILKALKFLEVMLLSNLTKETCNNGNNKSHKSLIKSFQLKS